MRPRMRGREPAARSPSIRLEGLGGQQASNGAWVLNSFFLKWYVSMWMTGPLPRGRLWRAYAWGLRVGRGCTHVCVCTHAHASTHTNVDAHARTHTQDPRDSANENEDVSLRVLGSVLYLLYLLYSLYLFTYCTYLLGSARLG